MAPTPTTVLAQLDAFSRVDLRLCCDVVTALAFLTFKSNRNSLIRCHDKSPCIGFNWNISGSDGQIRTVDLPIMSRALSPTELRRRGAP